MGQPDELRPLARPRRNHPDCPLQRAPRGHRWLGPGEAYEPAIRAVQYRGTDPFHPVVGNFLRDQKTNYLEGALCLIIYIIVAAAAYYYPNPPSETLAASK